MKIFIWTEDVLTNYANGHILVIASDVEEARKIAISTIEAQYRENFGNDYFEDNGRYGFKNRVIKPLELEPTIHELDKPFVHFSEGSD